MRTTTLLASLLVAFTIRDQAFHVVSYYVPRIFSSRSSRYHTPAAAWTRPISKHDGKPRVAPSTELRVSSASDSRSAGVQDYYAGDEDTILKVYEDWRQEYAKGDFDSNRYQNFKANYIKLMTANAAELTVARDMGYPDPVPLSLNEYGDLSPQEFNNLHTNNNDNNNNINGRSDPNSNAPSPLPFPQSDNAYEDDDDDDQERILQIYEEWCVANQRVYDPSRLPIFTTNLRVVEKYYRETGKKAELNEYADLSPEEYQAIATSSVGGADAGQSPQQSPNLENMSTFRQTPPSTLHQYFDETEVERIKQAYLEWCNFHGKDYIESRLDIFATNLLAVESFRAETGQNAFLNEYADLSPEEYNAILSPFGSNNNNQGASYLDSLSPTAAAAAGNALSNTMMDQGIRSIYQDWCNYYEKPPSEEGLYYFTQNYAVVEKRYRETGEELTMNEYADLPSDQFSQQPGASTLDQEKIEQEQEAARLKREEEERAEQARRNEEERKQAEERMRVEDERQQQQTEEEERAKLEADEAARLQQEADERIELARRNEEERKKAEELMRLERERKRIEEEVQRQKQEEERLKFEEARRRVEDAQLFEQKQAAFVAKEALEKRKTAAAAQESGDGNLMPRLADLDSEKERLRQERIRLEKALEADRARLKEEKQREEEAKAALEETNRQIDEIMNEKKEDDEDFKPDPIILPRSSYLDAVAKTWVDRTAYLEALQEGRAGALPYNPKYAQRPYERAAKEEQEKQMQIKESESLIDSIWNFMKEYNADDMGVSENYSRNLIQQADQLIEDTTKKSTGVMGEELRYLKKAVDAMRRRNDDDLAADRARTEAKEWEQIQKGLEKEAKEAKKRREHDERIADEARRKARSLKSERQQHEKRAEEARRQQKALSNKNRETVEQIRSLEAFGNDFVGQGNPFSFFMNPLQGGENKDASDSATEKSMENIFSFFGGSGGYVDRNSPPVTSMTQPVKIEKKVNWLDAVFGFFSGDEAEEDIPGQGTITLEPAKRKSVFDLFVSPDSIAPVKEPGRGSITIDDVQEESSIFSFFAKFGISQKKEKTIDPVRRKRVMDYENKLRSRQEKLSRLEAGRSRILNEKDKKLSRKEARRLQRELDSLAAGNYTSFDRSSEIPQLAKWTRTPDERITGWISDPAGGPYKMGTKITTSRIKGKFIKPGVTVTTVSGSKYRLGMTAARSTLDATSNNRRNHQQNDEKRTTGSQPSGMGSIFGRWFSEEPVPSLVEWIQNEDGTITGFVNNKEGFDDGTQITTSPVEMGATKGMVIQTKGGSKYKLMKEKNKNTYF